MHCRAKVLGTGSYLPGPAISNQQLSERVGPLGGVLTAICDLLQAKSRHLAIDLGSGQLRDGESNAAMAAQAARAALHDADREPSDIDLVILATSTPDYLFPGPAPFVQELLGIPERGGIMELRAGCGGMAPAMATATAFIEAGSIRHALLIGSELISPFSALFDSSAAWDQEYKSYLVALAMFGDGAGALVLGPTEREEVGVIGCMFRSMGSGRDPGMLLRAGGALAAAGAADGTPDGGVFFQDREVITREGPKMAEAAWRWVEDELGLHQDDVAFFVPPQVNGLLIDSTTELLGLSSEKVFANFSRVGNTSSASIYIALDELNRAGRLQRGDTIILVPAEATKWTYGAIALRWARESPP